MLALFKGKKPKRGTGEKESVTEIQPKFSIHPFIHPLIHSVPASVYLDCWVSGLVKLLPEDTDEPERLELLDAAIPTGPDPM